MINTRSWIGIFTFLLSFSVFAADIEISDAWIRPTTQGYENGMVGLTISTPSKIKIIGVNSPAFSTAEIQKPNKSKGKNKMETIKSVSLSAGKSLVLGSDNIHLALSGNKNTLNSGEKVPVILTVQFENKTKKDITFLAQPVRIRAGAAPLPMAATIRQTMPQPAIEQPAQAAQMQMAAPVNAEPVRAEVSASAEPVIDEPVIAEPVIAEPASQPTPEAFSPVTPVPVPQPPLEAAPQPAPEKILTEATDSVVTSPVEDCSKYSKAMNACNQAGELDDIMKCRNITKSKFSCT